MLQTDIIQQNEKREYDDIIGESYYTINDEDFNHYISTILFSLLDVFDENV